MDTLTHIALGACVGEILLGKRIGRKAMLIGALANSLPDIDFIAGLWLSPSENLLAHRGFTHSILFAIIATYMLTHLLRRWARVHHIAFKTWVLFFSVEIGLHLFIDAFNAYGIGWFEPFSHYRISLNTVFVADPLFSVSIGIATIALLILKKKDARRIKWAKAGIILCSVYFVYCVFNKIRIEGFVRQTLQEQHINYSDYFTTPGPFTNWLWYVVVKTDSGYYTGYSSTFDSKKELHLEYFKRNDHLLKGHERDNDVINLLRFSKGYYTVEQWHDTLVFNDLRFEQIAGWYEPRAPFAFHYYLNRPGNEMVLQRGRFQNWNNRTFHAFLERIKGN